MGIVVCDKHYATLALKIEADINFPNMIKF